MFDISAYFLLFLLKLKCTGQTYQYLVKPDKTPVRATIWKSLASYVISIIFFVLFRPVAVGNFCSRLSDVALLISIVQSTHTHTHARARRWAIFANFSVRQGPPIVAFTSLYECNQERRKIFPMPTAARSWRIAIREVHGLAGPNLEGANFAFQREKKLPGEPRRQPKSKWKAERGLRLSKAFTPGLESCRCRTAQRSKGPKKKRPSKDKDRPGSAFPEIGGKLFIRAGLRDGGGGEAYWVYGPEAGS